MKSNVKLLVALLAAAPILAHADNVTKTATPISFTLSGPSIVSVGYSWIDLVYPGSGNSGPHTNLLNKVSYSLNTTGNTFTSFTSLNTVPSQSPATLSLGTLASGTYYLDIKGTWAKPDRLSENSYLTKPSISFYGTPTITAAVPEPGEWAMMLAGLGMMGFVVRRRTMPRS
jgi:hypothetical protein